MNLTFKVYLFILLIPVFCFSQSIDTKHLSLQLQFDWKKRQASGIAEITATLINGGTTIYLDAGKLHIHSIEINSQQLAYEYDGGEADNNLPITLNKNYAPSEALTIRIAYQTTYENQADPNAISGSFGKGLRFFQATSTTPLKHQQIWSSGEPENNKYWFPCNEDIADIHTSEVYGSWLNAIDFSRTSSGSSRPSRNHKIRSKEECSRAIWKRADKADTDPTC